MNNKEAIHKLEYMRNAYQKLIDEKVDEGRLVGPDITGTWKADTPLNDAYKEHIEALDLAIAALEQREKAFDEWCTDCKEYDKDRNCCPRYNRVIRGAVDEVKQQGWIPCSERLPSAQPEQRYTEEELRVFQHGISLSLLSKRSSQHWQYDEDTATEIKFLERLYEKVGADMRGEQDGRFNQQTGGD